MLSSSDSLFMAPVPLNTAKISRGSLLKGSSAWEMGDSPRCAGSPLKVRPVGITDKSRAPLAAT